MNQFIRKDIFTNIRSLNYNKTDELPSSIPSFH
ncbi:hypothetical protein BSNT_07868 [Bacillus subtilis subsp. natto BEST195]|nr:hypothetical protein BSNT_07868 [Bacillus subtilis subsp. natto BEST195]